MAFKDILREAIEKFGDITSDNLSAIAEAAREIAPDITVAYINRLLAGQPPRGRDRLALEFALGIDLDEDLGRRPISEYAEQKFQTRLEKNNFVKFVNLNASFRDKNLGEKDLDILYFQFTNRSDLEIEIELFGLD